MSSSASTGRQSPLHRGIAQRDLVAYVIELGGVAEKPRRTGEVRLSHRAVQRPVLINGRRKDSSREAVAWVRRLEGVLFRAGRSERGQA
jgi:hypothetical protein